MTILQEGQLEFSFPEHWRVTMFDEPGKVWPKDMKPVDFVVERESDIVLMEIKDPSHTVASAKERTSFLQRMTTDELTHQHLAPKARSTWGYLHLMSRLGKPLRFVAVIGTDALSIQPPLLQQLGDRLRRRLRHEADEPWVVQYVTDSAVVAAFELHKYMPGVTVRRVL
jgi:hypothetical protein